MKMFGGLESCLLDSDDAVVGELFIGWPCSCDIKLLCVLLALLAPLLSAWCFTSCRADFQISLYLHLDVPPGHVPTAVTVNSLDSFSAPGWECLYSLPATCLHTRVCVLHVCPSCISLN